MTRDYAHLRQDYDKDVLLEEGVDADPFRQFHGWMEQARAAGLYEPNAMSVASVDAQGRPSNRMLLLKELDEEGFVFFTNYESRKGAELVEGAPAALLFWWDKLHRQVRIEGTTRRVSAQESDDYFKKRPLGSRIAAIVSQQSAPLVGRAPLEAAFDRASNDLGEDPARPAHWGGYRVTPNAFEFWQGRRSRLHDRLVYAKKDGAWAIERLAP